jgi:hypothetical protein
MSRNSFTAPFSRSSYTFRSRENDSAFGLRQWPLCCPMFVAWRSRNKTRCCHNIVRCKPVEFRKHLWFRAIVIDRTRNQEILTIMPDYRLPSRSSYGLCSSEIAQTFKHEITRLSRNVGNQIQQAPFNTPEEQMPNLKPILHKAGVKIFFQKSRSHPKF